MSGVGIEDEVSAAWIVSVLENDVPLMQGAPGGVHDGPAPERTPYPLVRIDTQNPGMSVRGVGTVEVMANSLWLVRAITEGTSYVPLIVPAQRIQSLLHGITALVVANGTIEACVREQAFRQGIVTGGREYRHLGGIFRIYVQGS